MRSLSHRLVFCFIFLFVVFFAKSVYASEVIQDFSVDAELAYDRTLKITETIKYDFGAAERHGIFRTIPTSYQRSFFTYRLWPKLLYVGVDGQPATFITRTNENGWEIRIGDAEKTITGVHTYVISYQTKRAINDFSDHTELYWNVTGHDWTVPINHASFTLRSPQLNRAKCFSGYFGDTETECDTSEFEQGKPYVAKTRLNLMAGMTAVLGFTPGTIQSLTVFDKIGIFVTDNPFFLLPFIVFAIMFYFWWKRGRDPKGRGVIIAHYEEPRGLAPAMMAGLMDEHVSTKAVTATILDLAQRGYLTIKFDAPEDESWIGRMNKNKVKISFQKKKDEDVNLLPFEKKIFDGIFAKNKTDVSMADLQGSFWMPMTDMRSLVFKELRSRGWFGKDPSIVRGAWIGGAVGFVVLFVMIGSFIDKELRYIASLASGVIIAVFGWFMPQRTKEGAILQEEIKGFKLFLSVTEKDRLDFTDAPEKKPEQFARFLPAAVALGVESKWAKQFEGIDLMPPSYFDAPTMYAWSSIMTYHMVDRMHEMALASAFSAQSFSSNRSGIFGGSSAGGGGSGFSGGGSGGGFGGGGGGSW